MRGKRMKSRLSLIITFLCFGSLLTSFIWSNNTVELHQLPLQKKDILQPSELCQGCSRHLSNVEPQHSESCKGCREAIDKAVEPKEEDDSQKIREVIEKGTESNSEISKTKEDNPPEIREVIDKAVEPKQEDDSQKIREVNEKGTEGNSEILKKQEDKPRRIRRRIKKVVRRVQNSKKQEDNPPKIREVIDETVEHKQDDNSLKIREVIEKGAESDSEISKTKEDKPPEIREVVDKAVEPKQEDDSQKIREVIEKGTESNSEISKTQEDKPRRIRRIIKKVVVRHVQNSKKQEDNPQQIREENNKVEDLHPQNMNTKEDDSQKIRGVIDKAVERYSQTWKKQEDNCQKLRFHLTSKCNGLDRAVVTQNSTPVDSEISYNGLKKTLKVTPELFSTFIKEHPFSNKTLDTCAVVGNGGILINSSCGETIDSAQFVIRCNLAPLGNGYEKHVGIKTDLVTANPSIFVERYEALNGRRRPFVEDLRSYGNSLLLLPAFSYSSKTILSVRAIYTIEDFESPIRPVYLNPEYVESLLLFWRSQGLRETRLSTGLTMVSLALELCNNVHLYGFWPFSHHPHDRHNLTNHYYDDIKPKVFHAMPAEFDLLMRLHSQGVLRLHLGDCPTGGK
ncbi:alpha-2,8-sialyltransferase 8F-like isoform X3 [Amphiprion ocellaris]|uniref:ST8 alpha-N-acetyl-neuraminide alpha-2,8-sialyltransferase 6 n=1 Tax=Amphiprion ocellaris TaxID=80972 RepID=A0AAQ5ZMX1_AMPOC|nr:alpha-2,8-sialyltransferase 8F-like isoform X3 [Amphiprion ocellaris]